MSWFLGILALILAIGVGVLTKLWWRDKKQWHREKETLRSQHADAVNAQQAEHQKELEAVRQDGEEKLDAERQKSERHKENFAAELRRPVTWERRSREILLKKLKASGSSGVLLTNIVFLVSDQRQIPRQIDHLIVTENKVILIENKGWKGLVFDGVLPSSVHKSYQSFIDERPLHQRDTFAVQLRNDDNEPRFEIDDPPTQQAASQARDLKNLFKRSGIPLNLTVCVFYSHQDVDLRAATCQTKWNVQVLDTDSITDVLPRPTNSAFIPVEDIVNVLDPYTSNITGFGDYTDTWPDML